MPVVTFQPLGKTVTVPEGTTILEAAEIAGVFMRQTCSRNAMCGTCRFRIVEGSQSFSPMARHESGRLKELYAPKDVRLGCQAQVRRDVVIEVSVPVLGR